jgi:DNA-binding transcriptional LysR family regulator
MARSWIPELVSLQILVDVGLFGSVGKAARAGGFSQPAASKRLTQLERDLKMSLVTRSPNGSQLTAHGRAVADWAHPLLDATDGFTAAVASLQTLPCSDLHVAASMTVAEHLIPRWLSQLRTAHPDVHVGLEVTNSAHVQQLLLDERVDIGFVEGPTIGRELKHRRVAEDRLVVVVAPDHPWAREDVSIDHKQLLEGPLVVRELGSGTRSTLEDALGTTHGAPVLELGSNEAVKGAVRAGAGAAVLSVLAVQADLADGRLHEVTIRDVNFERGLNAVWRRDSQLSRPQLAAGRDPLARRELLLVPRVVSSEPWR